MPFLDKEGLAYFWNQIIARLNRYETTENAQLKLDEAKSYTDNSIPTKVTDLENDAEYITADALSGLGGGDMLKATYDKDGDGVVDDAEKLGGVAASEYAKKTDIPTIPTIPTVNNATLTIQKNGTTVKTFTANSASNVTANITVPTGAAADKGVDTSISTGSTSTNLPTSKAVAAFVEGKGYKTTDNNTTYTFDTGDSNGQIKVTPSGGTAQNVSVKGLGSAAYTASTAYAPASHSQAASTITGLATVATSGNYNDLSGKPTIPTVNNATLTIQKNGTTVKTFTANSASNVTANITVPTKTSDLTNDSGYITANDIPESGGTDIDYGPSLPTSGSDGDIFLLTDTAGQTFTETISFSTAGYTDTAIKLAHKIRSIVSTVESDHHNYVTYNVTPSGMLHAVGDVYDPMDVTITYVSDGDWVVSQISDTVDISVSSYGNQISDVVLKATDSGNCITVLIDYSLSTSGASEESWTFAVSNGENKTFLAAYALGGNGLIDLTTVNGYNGVSQFGASLNNLNLYFVDSVPRFSGQKAALIIYYA